MSAQIERRHSKRLERRENSGPYMSRQGSSSAPAGSTGLTKYMGNTSLDWGGASEEKSQSGAKTKSGKDKAPALPKNWKKVTKNGETYYLNSVTQQRSHEVPPELPKGWKEALHKESGRIYYYNKASKESTFEYPTEACAGTRDADDDDDEAPPPPESFFGRTMSALRGKKKDDDISRSASIAAKKSMRQGGKKAAATPATEKKDEAAGSTQKTVFISCSTLIREVKLCVGPEHQDELDVLYTKLTSHQIPAEKAVKQLMELVGSTIVQQAGLSVMNSQKGTLPHGWLEYTDEASGRPYYYNVHTKVTTWYKPTGNVPPPPPPRNADNMEVDEEESAMGVNIECSMTSHNVAMTGFI